MSFNKSRILDHMNKDHKVSLYDYLAYYNGIRLEYGKPTHIAELVDIDLKSLTINYSRDGVQKTAVVPISPPMESLGDSRVRLVKMAFEAADTLQLSPYPVTDYKPPNAPGWVTVVLLSGAVALGIAPASARPALLRLRRPARVAAVLTVCIHFVEMLAFTKPRLDHFRVYGFLRFKWMLSTLFEGAPCWLRLDAIAERLKGVRAKFEAANP